MKVVSKKKERKEKRKKEKTIIVHFAMGSMQL